MNHSVAVGAQDTKIALDVVRNLLAWLKAAQGHSVVRLNVALTERAVAIAEQEATSLATHPVVPLYLRGNPAASLDLTMEPIFHKLFDRRCLGPLTLLRLLLLFVRRRVEPTLVDESPYCLTRSIRSPLSTLSSGRFSRS